MLNFNHLEMYMYLYKYEVLLTEEQMIKRMLLIQICLTFYLILFLSSLYILHMTDSNSSPITITDIFICSALRMFVVRLTLPPCSTASPKKCEQALPLPCCNQQHFLAPGGGYRAKFHLGPKLYPCPAGIR